MLKRSIPGRDQLRVVTLRPQGTGPLCPPGSAVSRNPSRPVRPRASGRTSVGMRESASVSSLRGGSGNAQDDRLTNESVGTAGDRRLTLVIGLLSRADGLTRPTVDQARVERGEPDSDRAIMVNMKLKDASICAIEAAQLLSDKCFCQSQEALVLDRILGVIDEL